MVDQARPASAPAASPARLGVFTRYYVLAVLVLVTSVGIMDRQIMGILIEPVRADLGLTDTELGFLTGMGFALVYVTAAFPVARLADRWSRVNVIAIGVSFWSLMTAACGLAQNAVHIFLARMGVAIGEAGGAPPSHALIGDLFPRHERGTAMSILMVCAPIGIAGGLFIGGWAVEHYGWRTAFYIAGAVGVLLGPLVFLTFPKIRQGMADGAHRALPQAPFLQTIGQLLAIRSFTFLITAAALNALLAIALTSWTPAFLARSHGMSPGEIGAALGTVFGAGSLIGHLAGGPIWDFMGRRDLRWHFWIPTATGPISGILVAVALLGPSQYTLWLLGLQVLVAGLMSGPLIAMIMNLAPMTSRATASAVFTLIINVLGVGLGPQLVGILSDALRPAFGEESLRYALLCAALAVIPAAICNFLGSFTYRADLDVSEARNKANVVQP